EHFNFLPESKKEVTTYVVTSFLERATRLARSTAVPRHAQRATNAPPGVFSLRSRPVRPSARWGQKTGAFAPYKRFAQQNLGGGRIHFARAF
ncbi:MAG: hypothetical protein Q3X77_05490, partial [Oscillospiraceae bacterium]|nr:hypothetical protein [Oscillospiraceae bacterium]